MSVDLESIFITGGVNESGVAFLTVAAHSASGDILIGQVSPAEGRQLALHWLEAAEAADQDAAAWRTIKRLGLPIELAASIVTELRNTREE